jgi:hypothetical protein
MNLKEVGQRLRLSFVQVKGHNECSCEQGNEAPSSTKVA